MTLELEQKRLLGYYFERKAKDLIHADKYGEVHPINYNEFC